MIKAITGSAKVFFGTRKSDNTRIYITKPSFDCDWYWSFGYLGNKNEHYHLESYQQKTHFFKLETGEFKLITEQRNINMYDALLADYALNPIIELNLWTFCELAKSIYTLKEAAELFHRGGSHYTKNPGQSKLQNQSLYDLLTFDLIPSQCQLLWDLIQEHN